MGLAPTASAAEIHEAYRRLARRDHPDAQGGGDAAAMSRVNEAWYVLQDPARRARYDATLRTPPETTSEPLKDPDEELAVGEVPVGTRRGLLPLPWVLILGALAVIFVFTAYAASRPGSSGSTVDGVLRPGSCVRLDGRLAREVPCDDEHDGVVEALVPIGATCRVDLDPYDDVGASSVVCVKRN